MICRFFILCVFLLCGHGLPCAMLWGTKPSQALGDEAAPASAPRKPSAQVTQAAQDTQRPTKKRRLDSDLDAVPEIGSEDEFCVKGHNATTATASTNTTLAVRNTSEDATPTRVLTIFDLPDEILGIILEFYSEPCYSLTDFWRKDSLSREAVNWRAVCRRFKKVYDEGGFLKRTSVWLLEPSQFTRFNHKTPAGLRPTDLFPGDLSLNGSIVKKLLTQKKKQIERSIAKGVPPANMKRTSREKMLWQRHKKGSGLELFFPTKTGDTTFAQVALLTALPVTCLHSGLGGQLMSADAFKGFTELTNLCLQSCHKLGSIEALGHCKQLRFLELSGCDRLTTLAGLEQCQALETLRLKCLKNLLDINVLAKLPALKRLQLQCSKAKVIPCIPSLEELDCGHDFGIQRIVLSQLPALKKLSLHGCKIQDILCEKPHDSLHTLRIRHCEKLHSSLFLTQCRSLENLFLEYNHNLESLSPCESLTHVHLEKCAKLRHTNALALSTNLTRVTLVNRPVGPLGALSGLENLVHLALERSSARDPNLLSTLQKLPSVKRLTLDCAPGNQQILQDYCDTKKIQVRFDYKEWQVPRTF